MSDYLVRHALANIWCTPDQDKSYVFRPQRLTPHGGAWDFVRVQWDRITLPDTGRFHVYQIGAIDPGLLGLVRERKVWTKVSDACTELNLIMDVYTKRGVNLPRHEAYIRWTETKNLILAVKRVVEIDYSFNEDPLYFRMYTNAFFASQRNDPDVDHGTAVVGRKTGSLDHILEVQHKLAAYKQKDGHCYCFINGRVVHDISLLTAKVGDVLEFVWDSSVKAVIDIPLSTLDTFDSTLDSKRKYLVTYDEEQDTIRFKDDNEYFLFKGDASGFIGTVYPRHSDSDVRMVTHQDYSIPVANLGNVADAFDEWQTHEELTLRMLVRRSGYSRELANEHGRILELYKLPFDRRKQSMLGIDSTVSTWSADALESSSYTEVMRTASGKMTHGLVEDAYGYNAIAKATVDSPLKPITENGPAYIDVPVGLQSDATMLEFDTNGSLLGWHYHFNQSKYFTKDPACTLVSGLVGSGGTTLDIRVGMESFIPDFTYNWRFYKSPRVDGFATGDWAIATLGEDYIIDTRGHCVWLLDDFLWVPMAKSDRLFLMYEITVPRTDDLFDVSVQVDLSDDVEDSDGVMELEMAQLDVWLNRRSLIEGIDFFVKWPRIVLCTNEYWNDAETDQVVTIRAHGLLDGDMVREPHNDVGWIRKGEISHNDRFNLRDDKVMTLTVFGGTYHRDDKIFSEDHIGQKMRCELNGKPYLMDDPLIPLRDLVDRSAYELRKLSKAVDEEVEDYMTVHYPPHPDDDQEMIPRLYNLFSPFLSKIIADLRKGYIDKDPIRVHYDKQTVLDICESYEYLLDFDPVVNKVDETYVSYHPHCRHGMLDVDIYTYTFAQHVIDLYLDNKIDISPFLSLVPGEDIVFD